MKHPIRNRLAAILLAIVLLLIVAGVFAQANAFGDLVSHFLPHLGVVALLIGIIAAYWALRAGAVILFAFAAYTVLSAPGRTPWDPFAVPACDGPSVKIMSANIHFTNRDGDALTRTLSAENPDVAVIFEVTPAWSATLQEIAAQAGYTVFADPRAGQYGSAVLSRFPVENIAFLGLGEGAPKLRGWVNIGEWRIRLGGAHLGYPLSPPGRALHAFETGKIVEFVDDWRGKDRAAGRTGALLILGDFNATPWSRTSARLFEDTGLENQISAFPGTWPTFLPSWIRIPIDQAFVAGNAAVTGARVIDNPGSDHQAITLTIAPDTC